MANTEFKIEKGIALPEKQTKCPYPLLKMQIGDSFYIDNISEKRVYHLIRYWVERLIVLKQIPASLKTKVAKEKDGARVWRIQ